MGLGDASQAVQCQVSRLKLKRGGNALLCVTALIAAAWGHQRWWQRPCTALLGCPKLAALSGAAQGVFKTPTSWNSI